MSPIFVDVYKLKDANVRTHYGDTQTRSERRLQDQT
jgi:hypothetical protein